MHIEKAEMKDLDRVVEILRDGRNQLAESGIDQWQGDYPNVEHIQEDIEHGFAYLVHSDDHETVGAFAIVAAPDHSYDELDGKWLVDTDNYLVIHRVAIHSDHAGNGYYTWWSHFAKARERNVGWRIDYFLVSKPIASRIKKASIHAEQMGSDHCPVSIEL